MGMTAVHVWRVDERQGRIAPPLEVGDHRVGDLRGVLDVLALARDMLPELAEDVS
jgi:hypothetical protein